MHEKTIREFSAGIIVVQQIKKQRSYLLLQYAAGHWDFPKGHIEKGESKEQAALRELQEEAGISATIVPGFEESFEYFYRTKSGDLCLKKVYFFIGQATTTDVTLSYEHTDFAWLPFKQAIKKLTYENAQHLLTNVENYLQKHPALLA